MKNINCRRWLFIVAVIFLAGLLSACGYDKLTWTEDVLLPDGRVVRLKRSQGFGGNTTLTESATRSNYWLEFIHPDTGEKLRYEGDERLSTVAVFIAAKTVFLVIETAAGGGHFEEGCPKPPFIFLKYSNGKWERISFANSPVKLLTQNMIDYPERDFIRQHKREINPALFGQLFGNRPKREIDIRSLTEPKFHCEKSNPRKHLQPAPRKDSK